MDVWLLFPNMNPPGMLMAVEIPLSRDVMWFLSTPEVTPRFRNERGGRSGRDINQSHHATYTYVEE